MNKVPIISTYGDSFCFGREVNDDQTIQHYLGKSLGTGIANFGVGNYGIDQALMRLKKTYHRTNSKIIIMIVVPDTINRITSVYKHYLEIGNFFAVKPRFIYEDKKLNIVDNPLTNKLELLNLKLYKKHFHKFDNHRKKFLNQVGKFPYSLSILLKKPVRSKLLALIFKRLKKNSIQNTIYNKLNQNYIKYTAKNFERHGDLLSNIIFKYQTYAEQLGFKPILIFIPQYYDIIFIKNNFHFFQKTIESITEKSKKVLIFDMSKSLLELGENVLMEIYLKNGAGHLSPYGNQFIANEIFKNMKKVGIELDK